MINISAGPERTDVADAILALYRMLQHTVRVGGSICASGRYAILAIITRPQWHDSMYMSLHMCADPAMHFISIYTKHAMYPCTVSCCAESALGKMHKPPKARTSAADTLQLVCHPALRVTPSHPPGTQAAGQQEQSEVIGCLNAQLHMQVHALRAVHSDAGSAWAH